MTAGTRLAAALLSPEKGQEGFQPSPELEARWAAEGRIDESGTPADRAKRFLENTAHQPEEVREFLNVWSPGTPREFSHPRADTNEKGEVVIKQIGEAVSPADYVLTTASSVGKTTNHPLVDAMRNGVTSLAVSIPRRQGRTMFQLIVEKQRLLTELYEKQLSANGISPGSRKFRRAFKSLAGWEYIPSEVLKIKSMDARAVDPLSRMAYQAGRNLGKHGLAQAVFEHEVEKVTGVRLGIVGDAEDR